MRASTTSALTAAACCMLLANRDDTPDVASRRATFRDLRLLGRRSSRKPEQSPL